MLINYIQNTLIYDHDQRATTTDMMQHAYFTDDRFPERFDPELRQTIEMEKEKEQNERMRRKRSKKVNYFSNLIIFQSIWILSKEAVFQGKKTEMDQSN